MQVNNQKIVVLGTGGTIAGESDSAYEGLTYKAAQRGIGELLKSVGSIPLPWPQVLAACQFEAEQVAQLDSKDMDFETWTHLAKRCDHWLAQDDVVAIVVTHGTDTLEETAYFLSQVIKHAKPIVLTCAMRPANFKDADGPQNLRDALVVAATTKGPGVWLVAAGEIHHSQFVQKVHPTRLNAFDSGETGTAGRVQKDKVQWFENFSKPLPNLRLACLSIAFANAMAMGRDRHEPCQRKPEACRCFGQRRRSRFGHCWNGQWLRQFKNEGKFGSGPSCSGSDSIEQSMQSGRCGSYQQPCV
jgi:L-asparaginase/Glu-tRNA(Gln) amidotransferase subunit D